MKLPITVQQRSARMNTRRRALQMLLGGIAAALTVPVFSASEITVYHSPD
jgi:hypothetical protein